MENQKEFDELTKEVDSLMRVHEDLLRELKDTHGNPSPQLIARSRSLSAELKIIQDRLSKVKVDEGLPEPSSGCIPIIDVELVLNSTDSKSVSNFNLHSSISMDSNLAGEGNCRSTKTQFPNRDEASSEVEVQKRKGNSTFLDYQEGDISSSFWYTRLIFDRGKKLEFLNGFSNFVGESCFDTSYEIVLRGLILIDKFDRKLFDKMFDSKTNNFTGVGVDFLSHLEMNKVYKCPCCSLSVGGKVFDRGRLLELIQIQDACELFHEILQQVNVHCNFEYTASHEGWLDQVRSQVYHPADEWSSQVIRVYKLEGVPWIHVYSLMEVFFIIKRYGLLEISMIVTEQISQMIANMGKASYKLRIDEYLFIIIIFDRGKVLDSTWYFYFCCCGCVFDLRGQCVKALSFGISAVHSHGLFHMYLHTRMLFDRGKLFEAITSKLFNRRPQQYSILWTNLNYLILQVISVNNTMLLVRKLHLLQLNLLGSFSEIELPMLFLPKEYEKKMHDITVVWSLRGDADSLRWRILRGNFEFLSLNTVATVFRWFSTGQPRYILHGVMVDRPSKVPVGNLFSHEWLEMLPPEDDFVRLHDLSLMVIHVAVENYDKLLMVSFFLPSSFHISIMNDDKNTRSKFMKATTIPGLFVLNTFEDAWKIVRLKRGSRGLECWVMLANDSVSETSRPEWLEEILMGVNGSCIHLEVAALKLTQISSLIKALGANYEGGFIIRLQLNNWLANNRGSPCAGSFQVKKQETPSVLNYFLYGTLGLIVSQQYFSCHNRAFCRTGKHDWRVGIIQRRFIEAIGSVCGDDRLYELFTRVRIKVLNRSWGSSDFVANYSTTVCFWRNKSSSSTERCNPGSLTSTLARVCRLLPSLSWQQLLLTVGGGNLDRCVVLTSGYFLQNFHQFLKELKLSTTDGKTVQGMEVSANSMQLTNASHEFWYEAYNLVKLLFFVSIDGFKPVTRHSMARGLQELNASRFNSSFCCHSEIVIHKFEGKLIMLVLSGKSKQLCPISISSNPASVFPVNSSSAHL